MSDRPTPLFRMQQRLYNRANPYHGKVVGMSFYAGTWHYTLKLDLPNRTNEYEATYQEDGLRATLEEAIEWQKSLSFDWYCGGCGTTNLRHHEKCVRCSAPGPLSDRKKTP